MAVDFGPAGFCVKGTFLLGERQRHGHAAVGVRKNRRFLKGDVTPNEGIDGLVERLLDGKVQDDLSPTQVFGNSRQN